MAVDASKNPKPSVRLHCVIVAKHSKGKRTMELENLFKKKPAHKEIK